MINRDPLSQIRIASPCHVDWNSMTGTERARFCNQCQLHVYDLSQLSSQEAIALITSTEGRICGRIHRRADGTVLTKDCPVGLRAIRRRVARFAGASLATILSLVSPLMAQKRSGDGTPSIELQSIKTERSSIAAWNARFRGTVLDPNGAAIIGANVELVDEQTQIKVQATTADNGEFIIPTLAPGSYSLKITASYFKPALFENIKLNNGEQVSVAATLDIDGIATMGILTLETFKSLESKPGTTIITSDMIKRFPIQ